MTKKNRLYLTAFVAVSLSGVSTTAFSTDNCETNEPPSTVIIPITPPITILPAGCELTIIDGQPVAICGTDEVDDDTGGSGGGGGGCGNDGPGENGSNDPFENPL